jgi:hypothetical protein
MKKILLLATVLAATISFANQNSNGQGQREMREPPQEAITICEGKSEGDTCSMTTPRGESVEGSCQNTPDGKYFVCMPEGHGQREER